MNALQLRFFCVLLVLSVSALAKTGQVVDDDEKIKKHTARMVAVKPADKSANKPKPIEKAPSKPAVSTPSANSANSKPVASKPVVGNPPVNKLGTNVSNTNNSAKTTKAPATAIAAKGAAAAAATSSAPQAVPAPAPTPQTVTVSDKPGAATQAALECKDYINCPYFSSVFTLQNDVKALVQQAFDSSQIKAPKWLQKGVELPTLAISYKGQQMLLGSICEPRNCPNLIQMIYTPSTQRVVGVWTNLDSKPQWIGKANASEGILLRSAISENGVVYQSKYKSKQKLPLVVK